MSVVPVMARVPVMAGGFVVLTVLVRRRMTCVVVVKIVCHVVVIVIVPHQFLHTPRG